MELHRFYEPVMEMCIAADKELKIEADVARFESVWKNKSSSSPST